MVIRQKDKENEKDKTEEQVLQKKWWFIITITIIFTQSQY
jgi:hypothetical protein